MYELEPGKDARLQFTLRTQDPAKPLQQAYNLRPAGAGREEKKDVDPFK